LDASQSGRIHFAEDGGARREIDMVSGSIDRPFYLHYENFEVFDERETKITYANLTHHVPAPDDVSGVQGRFVGAIDLSKAETVSARRSKALPIPAGIEALTAKSIVALAEKPQGKTRVRMGLQMQGDTCSGPWLDLDATATEQFKQYQAVIPIPSGAQQYMPILEVESANVGSGQTAYVDQIRVRYPEKQ
jgi:hypothetical protein